MHVVCMCKNKGMQNSPCLTPATVSKQHTQLSGSSILIKVSNHRRYLINQRQHPFNPRNSIRCTGLCDVDVELQPPGRCSSQCRTRANACTVTDSFRTGPDHLSFQCKPHVFFMSWLSPALPALSHATAVMLSRAMTVKPPAIAYLTRMNQISGSWNKILQAPARSAGDATAMLYRPIGATVLHCELQAIHCELLSQIYYSHSKAQLSSRLHAASTGLHHVAHCCDGRK